MAVSIRDIERLLSALASLQAQVLDPGSPSSPPFTQNRLTFLPDLTEICIYIHHRDAIIEGPS
jgi:hypothetical protein